jgi:hypothetical protein
VTVARAYTGKDNYYWYRIQMKLRAWNGSTLLKQYLVNSIHC